MSPGPKTANGYFTLAAAITLMGCAGDNMTRPSESMAMLRGSVPILAVDGDELLEPVLSQEISPGSHEVVVLHRTFAGHYRCRFQFKVAAGNVYELTVRPNPQPVALYRIERHSWLVGTRHDEVLPVACTELE